MILVIKTANMIYGIETNFYSSSGSKLNETARSYKTLALETEEINGFTLFGLQMVRAGTTLDIISKRLLMLWNIFTTLKIWKMV